MRTKKMSNISQPTTTEQTDLSTVREGIPQANDQVGKSKHLGYGTSCSREAWRQVYDKQWALRAWLATANQTGM